FQSAMQDWYQPWMTYLGQMSPPPATTAAVLQAFQAWALIHLSPGQAQNCYSLYAAALNGPVGAALTMWAAAGGFAALQAYNRTITDVTNALAIAPPASVGLNSLTDSANLSQTWARGSTEGFYDGFFGKLGGSYDAATEVITSAGVNISIQFTHLTNV